MNAQMYSCRPIRKGTESDCILEGSAFVEVFGNFSSHVNIPTARRLPSQLGPSKRKAVCNVKTVRTRQ